MADGVAVAKKRAIAEHRLREAVGRLSEASGVAFAPPAVPANRYPALYAAQLVEGVAEFLERLLLAAEEPAARAREKQR